MENHSVMKNCITIVLLSILCFCAQETKGQFVSYNQIENGKYEATVYYSSNTATTNWL